MRRIWLALAALPLGGAFAQTTPSNNVADCTLVQDPTALRLCVESTRQSRPASTFDPSAPQATTGNTIGMDLLPYPPRRGGSGRAAPVKEGDAPKASGQRSYIP